MMQPMEQESTEKEAQPAAYVLVSQDNQQQKVQIHEISPGLSEQLGYGDEELIEGDLLDLVSPAIAQMVREDLEYEDDTRDLDEVLQHVREFRVLSKDGKAVGFAHKVLREMARDQHQWFRIILKDERRQIQEASLQLSICEHLEGVCAVDETTGLVSRESCEPALQVVQNYVNSQGLQACFAVLRIDRYAKTTARYGKKPCEELVQHVANCCKSKFRSEDEVFALSDHTLGLLLVDLNVDAARIVLNRLRWFIASHRIVFGGKTDFSVTVSLAFTPIYVGESDELLTKCENAMEAVDAEERSMLVELKA